MITISHKGLGTEFHLKELKQKHVTKHGALIRKAMREAGLDDMNSATLAQYHEWTVQAAFDAAWFAEPETFDVAEAPPNVIVWLAKEINRIYLEAIEIPKN